MLQILQDTAVKKSELSHDLKELEQRINNAIKGSGVIDAKGAKKALEEARESVKDGLILKALYFGSVGQRYEDVHHPHNGTFEWIFRNSTSVFRREPGLSQSFPEWLESGAGIFHISGKPGSGKSTLMKYLYRHAETTSRLRHWAGDKELLCAKFFFWRIGATPEQKSLRGLVRSLLYEVLCKAPTIARMLLPEIWARFLETSQNQERGPRLSTADVFDAFDKLIQLTNSKNEDIGAWRSIRVCFFIDGLDEFDESGSNETHGMLLERLQGWTSNSSGNVKMCVSSRAQPPFTTKLDSRLRMTLDRLTSRDIKLTITGRLEAHLRFQALKRRDESGCKGLVARMTTAAEGVFLWVALLLNSLCRGLDRGDSLRFLELRLAQTPANLDVFLSQILDGIDPIYRKGAYLLLATMLRATGLMLLSDNALSEFQLLEKAREPMDLTYSDDLITSLSPLAAVAILEISGNSQMMSGNFELSNLDIIQAAGDNDLETVSQDTLSAIISARSNCLVEVSIIPGFKLVRFMHRAIPEFLHTYFTEKSSPYHPDDFQVTQALAWSQLVELKCLRELHRRPKKPLANLASALLPGWSNTVSASRIHFHLIGERFRMLVRMIRMMKLSETGSDESLFSLLLSIDAVAKEAYSTTEQGSMPSVKKSHNCRQRVWEPLSVYAYVGLYEFIGWVFRSTDILSDHYRLWNTMNGAIGPFNFGSVEDKRISCRTLEAMFVNGAPADIVYPGLGEKFHLWHAFLLLVANLSDDSAWHGIEVWLRHGASPFVAFHVNGSGRCDAVGYPENARRVDIVLATSATVGNRHSRDAPNAFQGLKVAGEYSDELSLGELLTRLHPPNQEEIQTWIDLSSPATTSTECDGFWSMPVLSPRQQQSLDLPNPQNELTGNSSCGDELGKTELTSADGQPDHEASCIGAMRAQNGIRLYVGKSTEPYVLYPSTYA